MNIQDEVLQSFLTVYFKEYNIEDMRLKADLDKRGNLVIDLKYHTKK